MSWLCKKTIQHTEPSPVFRCVLRRLGNSIGLKFALPSFKHLRKCENLYVFNDSFAVGLFRSPL